MGRASRRRPARLAAKLLQIRRALDLSQAQMVVRLDEPELTANHISKFERGAHDPPVVVLLAYARRGLGDGALLELLIDDELELPPEIPARRTSRRIR